MRYTAEEELIENYITRISARGRYAPVRNWRHARLFRRGFEMVANNKHFSHHEPDASRAGSGALGARGGLTRRPAMGYNSINGIKSWN
jgi:hypothetical protein